jgi:Mrp family chromosome partitioning ATPase
VIEGVSPTVVLETGKFEQFVEWARNNYSVIIIDSPPLGILSEAIVFGRMADDVVLVCRYDMTRKGALRQAARDLKKNRCPLTGIVLNGYKATGVERGYGYQYYGYPRYSKRYAAAEKPRKRRDKSAPA